MINSIELGNFLSHAETKLNFGEGVTVFVGPNGAGKSGIIDAITFALFGQHTRKSNKGLIRRGENQGYAKINFSINNKMLQATRKINLQGTLSSQFLQKTDEGWTPIAEGERKQFGESMTRKIEEFIGLDFEKLKIASIVRQGELNSIIKAKPKEFKELINAVIGIDKLDISSENMKIVLKNFRETILKEFGYDDSHIEMLKNEIKEKELEIKKNKPIEEKLEEEKLKQRKEISILKKKIEEDLPKLDKIKQLESRKLELVKYAKDAIYSIQKEVSEKERKIHDCEGCFEHLDEKKRIEKSLEMAELAFKETGKKIQKYKMEVISLKEQLSLAKKLHLENGKCPVCDSKVNHLNPLFQENHLADEQNNITKKIVALENQNEMYEKKKQEFSNVFQQIIEDETTLRAHSINDKKEIDALKKEISLQKINIQKIPININSGLLVEVGSIDSHSKLLYEKIMELENEIINFDENSFSVLRNSLDDKQQELSETDQKLGGILEKIRNAKELVEKNLLIVKELVFVKDYLLQINEIQENLFNRDGSVATSLRSWALQTISAKASEYLNMLNTKIQRIELSEKTRDVSITCYSKNTVLDLESLSGGEQVSIALSLRLGMTQLLGSSNLNFIILDEPTMFLDEERRKSLVRVLSQLSDITNSLNSPLQFIIITHDSEIFEDSSVEQIFKFESSDNGTIVTAV
ncbi:DNA double-strand break repair Rad50 ATPase [archaeon MnTg01]|nr:DNA double-strand break repair Rad50 ATPase [archaeon MnTg01]